MKHIFYIVILLLLQTHIAFSQGNPLFSDDNTDTNTAVINDTTSAANNTSNFSDNKKLNISIFNKFIRKNAKIQRELKDQFADLALNYNESKKTWALFLIFLFAFLYGIFHSLGPGHGKIFVFSYILTKRPKVIKAISTSYAIAFAHGLSGLIVALIIVLSLKTYASEATKIDNVSELITRISFGLITAIGIFLLLKNFSKKSSHSHDHIPKNKKNNKISFISFILSVGIIPCPGTIITVTFLSSMGLVTAGIIAAFFIMLGMGFTISIIALISLFSKKLIMRLHSKDTKKNEKTYRILNIAGAILLIIFSTLFLIGTF